MTRGEFLTYIKRDFKRTDKDTEIYNAYNDTLRDICSRGEPLEGYAFQSWIPCVVGQEDYPLPVNLLYLHHPVRLITNAANDDGYNLIFVDKERYDELEPNPNRASPTKAHPTRYTVYSNSILVSPIPDSTALLLEINWGRATTTVSNDNDTHNLLAGQWDEIIKYGTLMRLYNGLGLYEDAQVFERLYEDPNKGVPKILARNRDQRRANIIKVEFHDL